MSMEDKILDDDDIIDLTDLLEEGEPSKKGAPRKDQAPKASATLNEPDSFDLGKEISMEYDVSVEEIDQGGEGLDISASLSAGEEVALAGGREVKEEPILEDNEIKELDLSAADTVVEEEPVLEDKEAKELDFSVDDLLVEEPEIKAPEGKGNASAGIAEDLLVRGPAAAPRPKSIVPEPERFEPVLDDVETVSFDAIDEPESTPIEAEPVVEESAPVEIAAASGIEFDRRSPGDAVSPVSVSPEDLAAEMRKQTPVLMESIVRPLMEELMKDMVAATREMLPGIVEKVIREEIEKLKKLDS